jgi:hypothetical protein
MAFDSLARNGLIVVRQVRPLISDPRMLVRACESGELVRLRRGVYLDRAQWDAKSGREQHILRIRAVLASARRPLVFAGVSAAALWGMPIEGSWPSEVTVLDEWRGGGRSEPGVRRTAAGFMSARTVELQGIVVTDLARTVLDVARKSRFAEAVGSVDWALSERNVNAITVSDLSEELDRLRPRTGGRHLELTVGFGTPLSGSFGESTARAVIHRLGFEAPELQTEFRDAEGSIYTDFWWRRVRVAGEFDGKQKYTRQEFTDGDPGEVVWREKKREDWLRRQVNGVVRILTSDVKHPQHLERLLLGAGVPRSGSLSS